MLKIRLQRVGRRNDPAFRAVVTQSTQGPKSGRNLEIVGHHHPGQDKTELNGDAIKAWIGKGAQVSDTLYNLLIDKGILTGKKRNALPRRPTLKVPEAPEASGGAPAPEASAVETAPVAETIPAAEVAPSTPEEEVQG